MGPFLKKILQWSDKKSVCFYQKAQGVSSFKHNFDSPLFIESQVITMSCLSPNSYQFQKVEIGAIHVNRLKKLNQNQGWLKNGKTNSRGIPMSTTSISPAYCRPSPSKSPRLGKVNVTVFVALTATP